MPAFSHVLLLQHVLVQVLFAAEAVLFSRGFFLPAHCVLGCVH
jgi:hypothetical protein